MYTIKLIELIELIYLSLLLKCILFPIKQIKKRLNKK